MDAGSRMVTVPAGRVTLSDRRTRRSWTVGVRAFALAAVPTTREWFAAVTGRWPGSARGDRLPVETVAWWDAVRFCNAASEQDGLTPAYLFTGDEDVEWVPGADGYRLPTEAEWEHACRAGTTGARYGPLDEIAWYRRNAAERVHEVGRKQPNAWGLYDMLGNVWEWCWDVFDAENHSGYRVLRGGGWFDQQWSCRASVRRRSHPSLLIDDTGFRVARSLGH